MPRPLHPGPSDMLHPKSFPALQWQSFGLFLAKALLIVLTLAPSSSTASIPYFSDSLRVAAPARERVFARLSPYGPGLEHELVEQFGEANGYKITWLPAADRAEALAMLRSGKADLAVGFTEAQETAPIIATGPSYAEEQSFAISSRTASSMSSRAADMLLAMHESPIMQRQQAGLSEHSIILDGASWSLWQPFVHAESRAAPIESTATYSWHWRTTNAILDAQLQHFWNERHHPEDDVLEELNERYFGFIPDKLNASDLRQLSDVVAERLPLYGQSIAKAALKSEVDPLLLAAVIFQESRFDAKARSHTGVRGIMQLTRATAGHLKVNRLDPHQSINGGARYLRIIWDGLEDLNLEPWDRWFFTLAGFNQGPGHLRDAIRLSQELGGTGRTWRELKEVFPKLAQATYHKRARYGYCRGNEAVDFVESVRWYYYVLSGLATLERPEAKHLAPLLAVRSDIA